MSVPPTPEGPPPPPEPGTSYQQPYSPPGEYGYGDAYAPRKTGMATTSLVLGILSIPCVFACVGPLVGLVAVILGIVAIARSAAQPNVVGGRGRAVGGIVTGVVGLLLIVPIVMFGGVVFGSGGVATRMADLGLVGQGLEMYQQTHNAYPPDLATLDRSGMISPNPLDPGGAPTAHTAYVVGIEPGDPRDWIVAYTRTQLFGQPLFGILYVNGETPMMEPAEFNQELSTFKQNFEAQKGHPPKIIEPAVPTTAPTSGGV